MTLAYISRFTGFSLFRTDTRVLAVFVFYTYSLAYYCFLVEIGFEPMDSLFYS